LHYFVGVSMTDRWVHFLPVVKSNVVITFFERLAGIDRDSCGVLPVADLRSLDAPDRLHRDEWAALPF
jgi:hypothetical protein